MKAEGEGDLSRLSVEAGEAFLARGWVLATAESCTGGGIAECLTRTAGSSAWFDRGFITYTNDSKQQMLGVRASTLAEAGAVSEQTALEMAQGALSASGADLALAVTGIAGPGGATPGKPVGMVCFAWALRSGRSLAQTRQFQGDRDAVREASIRHSLRQAMAWARETP